MTEYDIVQDRERGVWRVNQTGDHARYVATFDTRREAEDYILEHSTVCHACGRPA